MSLRLFRDEHIDSAITDGLRRDRFDVVTAQEDESDGLADDRLLTRAGGLDRVLVTHDQDFLALAAGRQSSGVEFNGIIYGRREVLSIGQWIDELATIVYCFEPIDVRNQVHFVTRR